MLKRVKHASIVECHDVFQNNHVVAIIMDRICGGDLYRHMQSYWRNQGDIMVSQANAIIARLVRAVNYLHQNSVVHRDIKPANILCECSNDGSELYSGILLADFGLAVDCQPQERLHDLCGTRMFRAPEMYLKDYALKVDVWSVGIICYWLLSRSLPLARERDYRAKVPSPALASPVSKNFLRAVLLKNEVHV